MKNTPHIKEERAMKRIFSARFGILENDIERLADALSMELITAVLNGKIDLNAVAREEKAVRDRYAAIVKENEAARAMNKI